MHSPQELERIRFCHDCAEKWRALARGRPLAESEETSLLFATLWDELAVELSGLFGDAVAVSAEIRCAPTVAPMRVRPGP
jgi:hypothetical protein